MKIIKCKQQFQVHFKYKILLVFYFLTIEKLNLKVSFLSGLQVI